MLILFCVSVAKLRHDRWNSVRFCYDYWADWGGDLSQVLLRPASASGQTGASILAHAIRVRSKTFQTNVKTVENNGCQRAGLGEISKNWF